MAKIPILGGFWRFWRPGGKFAPGGKKGEKGPPQNRGRIFPEFPDPDFPTFRTAIGSTPVDEKTEKAKKNNLSRLGELLNTLRKRTKFNDFGGGPKSHLGPPRARSQNKADLAILAIFHPNSRPGLGEGSGGWSRGPVDGWVAWCDRA